ncbi:hypothetical protein ANTRET_LOCUS9175 [Anthophora retusa]
MYYNPQSISERQSGRIITIPRNKGETRRGGGWRGCWRSKQRTQGAFITYRPRRWGVCYARFLEITFQADNYW